MTTYTFTGANGDPLPAGLTERNGTFEIQSNKAVATGASPGGGLWLATAAGTADGTFSVVVNGGGSATNANGLCFRYSDGSNHWLALVTHASSTLQLIRRQAAANTVEGSYAIPSYNSSTDYLVSVTTSGSSISVSLDGTERITHTNTFNQAATLAGLRHANTTQTSDDLSINEGAGGGGAAGRMSIGIGIRL